MQRCQCLETTFRHRGWSWPPALGGESGAQSGWLPEPPAGLSQGAQHHSPVQPYSCFLGSATDKLPTPHPCPWLCFQGPQLRGRNTFFITLPPQGPLFPWMNFEKFGHKALPVTPTVGGLGCRKLSLRGPLGTRGWGKSGCPSTPTQREACRGLGAAWQE